MQSTLLSGSLGNSKRLTTMAKGFPTELVRAFLDTGALVFGGIGGAGAYYLMFGEYWILQTCRLYSQLAAPGWPTISSVRR